LLIEQAQVLDMIVRGQPLGEVLHALCGIVEREAASPAHATIALVDAAAETGARAEATWSTPILASSGAVLGAFGTSFTEHREPVPRERRLVEVLARAAALAIERDRAARQLHDITRRQRFLAELDAATQVLSEPAAVMATSARLLAEHLEADRCAYAEVEDERVFNITGDHTRGVPSIVGRWEVAAFGPACLDHMLAGTPYVVEDAEADPRITGDHLVAYHATTIRSGVCVPLHKAGRFTAAMAVHQRVPRRWSAEEIELVGVVVGGCWEALERSRVSRDLRESEARFRAIVEATPECVKLVSADGRLVQMNAAGLRIIEATEAEAVTQIIYPFIAPEHRDMFRAFNEAVCRGQGGTLAFDVISAAGTRRAMESTAVALPAPTGGFMHLAVARDVTARVAADRAVAESRARLDYAVRLSGVGFWYCDLPFDVLTWDAQAKGHFFMPPDERVTIETFYDRIHPEDREPTREAIDLSIRGRQSYDMVYRAVDPSTGAIKWIRALGGAAYDPDGAPIRFDGVTVDVTAQKHDEERLGGVARAALKIHSTSSLASVVRVVTEEARALIGAHRAVTAVVGNGGPLGAVAHAAAHRGQVEPTVDHNAVNAVMERVTRATRVTRGELAAGPPWPDLLGGSGPARGVLAVPFVGRDGDPFGFIEISDKLEGELSAADEAIAIQLAQLAVVAIENARLYDQLRDQDRRKDEFLATLAHELRNPLAPIRTGLHVLQHEVTPEQSTRALEMMSRQLVHLVRMVDDLLEISRVTLGKIQLQRARVDLRAVLDSALETTRSLVEARGHELAVRVPSQPMPIDVDPTRLSQVFANLINNAAKYTPDGGRISITAEVSGPTLSVRVRDTGVGIPADMLPDVFDMFTQVGQSIERSQGGLGIGLTLVRRLVEMHDGTVSAHSDGPSLGSTFVVTLPLAPAQDTTSDPEDVEPIAPGLRVLVVDDNVDAAEMLAMLLELRGHQISLAHNGRRALELAAELSPQVIFLDIGLPGLNGYEVARQIRAGAGTPPMLVALTGWGTDEDRRQSAAAGFDTHLVKPVDLAKIEAVLVEVRRRAH